MNPETSLCWHPLLEGLNDLKKQCLLEQQPAPHWDRVENVAGAGTPDLSWAWQLPASGRMEGHIELKYRAAPPVRPETPVALDTITSHQRLWWRQRWEAGGSVFVLVRLAEEYMLFQGLWSAFHLGNTTLEGLRPHASIIVPRRELKERTADILKAAVR